MGSQKVAMPLGVQMSPLQLRGRRSRRGSTLVEWLVAGALCSGAWSFILPAIELARENARTSRCRSQLRQFYLGFATYADRDDATYFSTGAFDARRDGCIDRVGWVADMVNNKVCRPQELLCPSNPARGSRTYNDYLGPKIDQPLDGGAKDKVFELGACAKFGVGGWSGEEVAEHFLQPGYGSNYMTTWFLVRGGPQVRKESSGKKVWLGGDGGSLRGVRTTRGPLRRDTVDRSVQAAHTIPLAGDAAFAPAAERAAAADVRDADTDYIRARGSLAESFSSGPIIRVGQKHWSDELRIVLHDPDAPAQHVYGDEAPPAGTERKQGRDAVHLQDYRAFGPNHIVGSNVIFADGAVKSFADRNRDGLLNPGFAGRDDEANSPYADDAVEVPAAEIFSGVLLDDLGARLTDEADR